MSRITCEIIRDLLPLYSEGEASSDTKTLVEEHLAECPACAAHLEALKAPLTVPMETEQHIMGRIKRKRRIRRIRNIAIAVLLVVFLLILPAVSIWQDSSVTLDASDLSVETTSTGYTRLLLSDRAKGGILSVIYTQDQEGNATAYVSLQYNVRLAQLHWKFRSWLQNVNYYTQDELLDVYDVTWTFTDDRLTEMSMEYTSSFGTCESVILSDAITAVYYQPGIEKETGPFSDYMNRLINEAWNLAMDGEEPVAGVTEEELNEMIYSHYQVPDSDQRVLIWEKNTED